MEDEKHSQVWRNKAHTHLVLGQSDQLKKYIYCVNRTKVHGHPKEIQAHSTLGIKSRSLIQLKYVEPMRKN